MYCKLPVCNRTSRRVGLVTAEALGHHEQELNSDQLSVPVLSLIPTNDSEKTEQNPFNVLWKQSKLFFSPFSKPAFPCEIRPKDV